jgi:hypothetical protein
MSGKERTDTYPIVPNPDLSIGKDSIEKSSGYRATVYNEIEAIIMLVPLTIVPRLEKFS